MDINVEISQAVEADAEEASALLREAAAWLEESGMALWKKDQFMPTYLLPYIQHSELFLARQNGIVIGTMLLQESDLFFWPDVPEGESLFLHKLAVRRSVAGQGVSRMLIQAAREEARQRGKRYLRLDCIPRPRLRAFYESVGFTLHSERAMGQWTAIRYEILL